jgi:hypothetical protein
MSSSSSSSATITKSFVQEIPENVKKLLELEFFVYTTSLIDSNNNGCWTTVVLNNKKVRYIFSGQETNTNQNRCELISIIRSIQHIYEQYKDANEQNYIHIHVLCKNIYCTNTLREWIYQWQATAFQGKPNADLLQEIFPMLNQYRNNLSFKYEINNHLEYYTMCDSNNEKVYKQMISQ